MIKAYQNISLIRKYQNISRKNITMAAEITQKQRPGCLCFVTYTSMNRYFDFAPFCLKMVILVLEHSLQTPWIVYEESSTNLQPFLKWLYIILGLLWRHRRHVGVQLRKYHCMWRHRRHVGVPLTKDFSFACIVRYTNMAATSSFIPLGMSEKQEQIWFNLLITYSYPFIQNRWRKCVAKWRR
jgi:hypothetical protein